MSKSDWTHNHNRYALVHDLTEGSTTVISDPLPAHLAEEFDSAETLLRHLHQRWVTCLEGALDAAMENGGGSPADDIRDAYGAAMTHYSGLRRILDANMGHPVLHMLTDNEHWKIAQVGGLLHAGGHVRDAIAEVAGLVATARPSAPAIRGKARMARVFIADLWRGNAEFATR